MFYTFAINVIDIFDIVFSSFIKSERKPLENNVDLKGTLSFEW